MGLPHIWPMPVCTGMCHPWCVFFVIFKRLLFRAGFRRHLYVGYNLWYLMCVSLDNCMRQNTLFYMFNKDNTEPVTQIIQGHVEC